jgi:hypothetical protein
MNSLVFPGDRPEGGPRSVGPHTPAAIAPGNATTGIITFPLTVAPGRLLTLALTTLVAIALNRALATYANGVTWIGATQDDWTTTAALSFLGVGIISHVAIGLRWPFALKIR